MNVWDLLILALILGAVVLALKVLRGKKKAGGCSCGCGGCRKECAARREE